MHSLKIMFAAAAVVTFTACSGGGGGNDSPTLEQPADTAAPAAEKVSFSALARDMLKVQESEAAWDVSQFDIEMDIDEDAEPTAFDDLFNAQP